MNILLLFNFLNGQSNRCMILLIKQQIWYFRWLSQGMSEAIYFFFLSFQTIFQFRFATYEPQTVLFKTPLQQVYYFYFPQKFRSDRQIQPGMTKSGQNNKLSSQFLIQPTLSIQPSMNRVTNSGQSEIFIPKRQILSRIPKSAPE